ncbi:MAG: TatD family hydrolase [Methylophaga sp.]|nr:TatD family hydrolase [Methylophaga sp.]
MHLIDSHCHLDFKEFDLDRDQLLSHCQQLGIKDIVIPGVTAQRWNKLLTVCQGSAMLHPALGLHPMFMAKHQPEHLIQLAEHISNHHIIAVGEIGLDFYIADHDKESQVELFSVQLKIAQQAKLPVLLHVRKAHEQTISLLKQYPVVRGIIHAFSGSLQQAKQYQDLGFLLGIGGAITHLRATRLRAMVSQLPLSSIVLETDAPDMPLHLMKQQYNTPENITVILDALTALRTENKDVIASTTTENCQRVLGLENK